MKKLHIPTWIPYNYIINDVQNISFARNIYATKTPIQKSNGIFCTEVRAVLDRSNFSKLGADGFPTAKNRNVNSRFMFNRTSEDTDKFMLSPPGKPQGFPQ